MLSQRMSERSRLIEGSAWEGGADDREREHGVGTSDGSTVPIATPPAGTAAVRREVPSAIGAAGAMPVAYGMRGMPGAPGRRVHCQA